LYALLRGRHSEETQLVAPRRVRRCGLRRGSLDDSGLRGLRRGHPCACDARYLSSRCSISARGCGVSGGIGVGKPARELIARSPERGVFSAQRRVLRVEGCVCGAQSRILSPQRRKRPLRLL
jgi:hypothetical protein